jgi:L-lactate dehydrogenase (cytochrome)
MTHTIQPSNPETTPATETTDIPATRPGTGVAAAAAAVPAALKRRLPEGTRTWRPLMQFKKPEFSKTARLKRASTIWELRDMAKRRTPQAPFDYTDGAAEEEITLRRARQAFQDIEFRPGVLRECVQD